MRILLNEIITHENIRSLFQPLFCLRTGEIKGYEALTRGPMGTPVQEASLLFSEAKKEGVLWELEKVARKKALEKSAAIINERKLKLFLNVDPSILEDEEFKSGVTKGLLDHYNIKPERICFEITERSAIFDFQSFKEATDNYKRQGYSIAIDDAGSGYSGLERISEVRPNYIKIDISLIRNIHQDPFKQALIKSFVNLAANTNLKIVAEGIESKAELTMLIKLGVDLGQGYFLGRPSENFTLQDESLKAYILSENKCHEKIFSFADDYHHIGSLVQFEKPFRDTCSCSEVLHYMRRENYESVCIVHQERPIGLMMQQKLLLHFAEQFGNSLYAKKPIALLMDESFLMVDYYEAITSVSEKAMNRIPEKTYDSIVVTKNGEFQGLISIKTLLNYTTSIEKKNARELNPLSNLPGNMAINRVLRDVIRNGKQYALLYFDLDHFKVYNDVYGFENGDRILKFTAELITEETQRCFPFDSFVGHIGGDDFLCVVEGAYERAGLLCENIKTRFDKEIKSFYCLEDAQAGHIHGKSREGILKKYPLTSISIAGYHGALSCFENPEALSILMSRVKKQVKAISGSAYFIERRLVKREEVVL